MPLDLISYPLNIFNALISLALTVIYFKREQYGWTSPFSATLPVTLFFLLANIFLVIAPLVPPAAGNEPYESIPYWLHVVVGFGVLFAGMVYWAVWTLILPRFGNYRLERQREVGKDGLSRSVFRKVHNA